MDISLHGSWFGLHGHMHHQPLDCVQTRELSVRLKEASADLKKLFLNHWEEDSLPNLNF